MLGLAAIQLDVRLVLRVDDRVLLARPPGDLWYVLPGGPVQPGEDIEDTLGGHLDDVGDMTTMVREFVGVVEHSHRQSSDMPGPTTALAAGHDLTILFATVWPADTAVPAAWQHCPLVAVDIDVLLATRLRPLPVAWAVRRWLAEGWPLWQGIPPAATEMGWGRLRPSVASLRAQLTARRDDLRGSAFRDASVAICALVTAADGRIDPAEREGMRGFVATDPVMASFPAAELEQLFDMHLARLQSDFAAGKRAALAEIAKVRGRAVEARAVVRIGEVIGRVDGAFAPSEQAVVREAIDVLGLDPTEFA